MGNTPNAFLGAGINFSSASAIRVGYGDWELGRFSNEAIGIDKIFRFDSIYYCNFGFGVSINSTLAFLAGAGFNYKVKLGFGVRGELFAVQDIEGYSTGAGTLGVSWGF